MRLHGDYTTELITYLLTYYKGNCDTLRRGHHVFGMYVRPPSSFVRPDRSLLPRYLMNDLSNIDESYRQYSLAPTDDLVSSGGRR